jgi:hypothetical protein
MIKTVRPLLKHHLANSFLTSAAEHAYGAFIHTARRMLLDDRAFFRAYDVDAVEPGTTDLNHALDQLKYSQSYHFDDSGAMMRWKIAARKIDQLHIARSKHTGNKAFYLLIRCREINERALLGRYKGVKLMTVMDYGRFDLDPSIPEGIISGLMALFFASDADICEIVSSDENICRCARRHGMMRVGAGMSFAYSVPADWKLGPQRGDIDQWHLTHYRGDAFGFE